MVQRIALLSISVALVLALSFATTLALFTDRAANPGNEFYAGTVSVEFLRDLGDPVPGPMFYTTLDEGRTPDGRTPNPNHVTGPWAPGDTYTRIGDIHNRGDMPIWVSGISVTLQEPLVLTQPHIGSALRVTVTTPALGTLINNVALDQFINSQVRFNQPIWLAAGGGNQDLWFHVHLPPWVGDPGPNDPDGTAYMGQRLKVQFNVHAVQAANNPNP